ncbi:hypothetical protein V8C86DRAFT_921620 [Haematococcus lacustris]
MADFISCLAHAFIAHRKLEHSRARIPSHCPCEPGSEAGEQEPSCPHRHPSHPPFRQHLGSAGAVRSRHSLGQAVAGSCQPASGSITVEALIPSRPCSSHSSHNSLAAPGPASCPGSEGPGQSAALGAVVPHLSITETPLSKQHLQTYLRCAATLSAAGSWSEFTSCCGDKEGARGARCYVQEGPTHAFFSSCCGDRQGASAASQRVLLCGVLRESSQKSEESEETSRRHGFSRLPSWGAMKSMP